MELVGHGDERETLGVSANSRTDPDAQARCETDRDLSARSQYGVLRLLGPHDDRAVRTRHHDDAGQTQPPPKPALVASPNSSLGPWWPDTATNKTVGRSVMGVLFRSSPCWTDEWLTSGLCRRWLTNSVCRSAARSYSLPPKFRRWETKRCPASNRSCAALTFIQPGSCCPICT